MNLHNNVKKVNEMNEFAYRLKAARLRADITQDQLAKIMNVSKSTISMWENGNRIPSVSVIIPLAKALHVSPAELTGGSIRIEPSGRAVPGPDTLQITEDSEEAEPSYYYDPEAAQLAQELFERPEMRVLFDASRKASKEDIEQVAALLEKLSQK